MLRSSEGGARSHPNGFLTALPPNDFALIAPHLKLTSFSLGKTLGQVGDQIDWVYFPHDGLISLVVTLTDGHRIEAAIVGRDGVAGGASAIMPVRWINTAIVQIAGSGSMIEARRLREAVASSSRLQTQFFLHQRSLFAQTQQAAACNARHAIRPRLCTWLLRVHAATGQDELHLTQEFLAEMLGVQRASVSLVAATLQAEGLIQYARGRVRILDKVALNACACECFDALHGQPDHSDTT